MRSESNERESKTARKNNVKRVMNLGHKYENLRMIHAGAGIICTDLFYV